MTEDGVCDFEETLLEITPDAWPFEIENKEKIADEWRSAKERLPDLFDGRIFVFSKPELVNGTLSSRGMATRYSAFLSWRASGFPEPWAHIFGATHLISSDGALVFGIASSRTSLSGKAGPFAGNLDPADITPAGYIDPGLCARREALEESGIDVEKTGTLTGRKIAKSGNVYAVSLIYRLPMTATEIHSAVMDHQKRLEIPEIADTIAFRRRADLKALPPDRLVECAALMATHLLPE